MADIDGHLDVVQEMMLAEHRVHAMERLRQEQAELELEMTANPGIHLMMSRVGEDPRAREAITRTYQWLRDHGVVSETGPDHICPAIDRDHLAAVWRFGQSGKGRLKEWAKGVAKSNPDAKPLLRSTPRRYRFIPTLLLKTVEEIETGAARPAP